MVRIYWPRVCGDPDPDNPSSLNGVLWDDELTLNTSTPDLTPCFQQTVLLWVPLGFLWLSFPIYLVYLRSKPKGVHGFHRRSKLNIVKLFCGSLLVIVSVVDLVLHIVTRGNHRWPLSTFLAPSLSAITYAVAVILVLVEYTRAVHSSGILFFFWIFMVVVGAFRVRSDVIQGRQQGPAFALSCVAFSLTILQLFLTLINDHGVKERKASEKTPLLQEEEEQEDKEYKTHEPCPQIKASFISNITFSWIARLIFKSNRRPLTFADTYQLRLEDRCENIMKAFYHYWFKASQKYRLWLVLAKTVKGPLVLAIVVQFLYMGAQLTTPLVLGALISFVGSSDPYQWKGYFLAVLLFLLQIVSSLSENNSGILTMVVAMRLRTAVIAAVYRKALKLSHKARRDTTVGQIVNLVSVDSQRIFEFIMNMQSVWTSPIMIAVSVYLLWMQVGWASLGGLAFLVLLGIFNGACLARILVKLQKQQMVVKDQRIKVTNEILSGIKVLKFYAWEQSFFDKVNECRERELTTLRKRLVVMLLINVAWFAAPYLVSLIVFAIYALTSGTNSLPSEKAFVSLNIINTLNNSLNLVPIVITFSTQAFISVKRIRKMLLREELEEDAVREDDMLEESLRIDNGEFTWDDEDTPVLSDINLRVGRGKLVAVVGQVGSGKSSLLNAMLGELQRVKGEVTKQGSFAYAAQQAWIQNMTLKENVLFGRDMDHRRYQKVLDACALMPDLEILPSGEDTEIGEKGINLSGGQKQRVSLARAVYQDAEIYLLDDVMSAVDAHVGKQLFRNVIGPNGILKHKTRVLVTHSVTYLPEMDEIVVLKDGRIAERGTFQELVDSQGSFAEFVQTYLKETEDNSDESDPEALEVRQKLIRQLSQTSGSEGTEYDKAVTSARRRRNHSSISQPEMNGVGTLDKRASEKARIDAGKIVEKEKEETGRISLDVAVDYLRSCGISMVLTGCFGFLLYISMASMTNIWLSMWSDDVIPTNVTEARALTNLRLAGYGGLGTAQVFGMTLLSVGVFVGALWASRNIHARVLRTILHAPSSFFDTTPLGRILNRFSFDVERIDNFIPFVARVFTSAVARFFTIVIINTYSTPVFAAVFVPLFIAYFAFQRVYIAAARQLKRIESVLRSPIYSHLDETLHGVSTIRAYGRQGSFTTRNQQLVDENQMAWYAGLVAQRWMSVTLHCLVGCMVVLLASVFAVLNRGSVTAGVAGMSISLSLSAVTELMVLTRSASNLENFAVSIERLIEYCKAPQESKMINEENRPDADWPSRGDVTFTNYSTRYRPGLDLVLTDISAAITGGEKIGVVGRTGAGKSSMTLALFRLIEAAGGAIYVDGMNIADVGLYDLRSRLTIIPQDPVLFGGSLRMNLDPFGKHTDDHLWGALEQSHLKAFVMSLSEGLDYNCGEGGTGLSVGQRQLLCLARALLRKSRILVLDEATAAVDMETDDLIQTTIRQEFSQCTVITIAHRINTIMDYDRVLVLDRGQVVEFDLPSKLLEKDRGIFYQLAKNAGLI